MENIDWFVFTAVSTFLIPQIFHLWDAGCTEPWTSEIRIFNIWYSKRRTQTKERVSTCSDAHEFENCSRRQNCWSVDSDERWCSQENFHQRSQAMQIYQNLWKLRRFLTSHVAKNSSTAEVTTNEYGKLLRKMRNFTNANTGFEFKTRNQNSKRIKKTALTETSNFEFFKQLW